MARTPTTSSFLINIVRLRRTRTRPSSSTCRTSLSQFEVAGHGNYFGGYGNQTPGPASLGFGDLALRDTPTLSYHPREGREIATALLTPLSADLFIVVNGGANLEQLLLYSVNDINDVSNATRATTLVPKVPDNNVDYLRGIRLMASLRDRDATELGFGTDDQSDDASDPMAKNSVKGRDLLSAAEGGYVYRADPDNQVTLLKREKGLYLRIRPPYVNSPEMKEIARIFHVTPGLSKYRLKSELNEELNQKLPKPLGSDTLYLNLRSVLQIMTFLSKGVCVPEEHVSSGEFAPVTLDQTRPALRLDASNRRKFSPSTPRNLPASRDAEVAVPYRGILVLHRFQRRELTGDARYLLEIVFALQESGDRTAGPLLTLPIGGR